MMMNVKRQLSLIKVNLGGEREVWGLECECEESKWGKLRLIDGYVRGFYPPGP